MGQIKKFEKFETPYVLHAKTTYEDVDGMLDIMSEIDSILDMDLKDLSNVVIETDYYNEDGNFVFELKAFNKAMLN